MILTYTFDNSLAASNAYKTILKLIRDLRLNVKISLRAEDIRLHGTNKIGLAIAVNFCMAWQSGWESRRGV